MTLSSRRLVGLLADDPRRRVVAAMILGAAELGAIARDAGIAPREAVEALDRLVRSGLVEDLGENRFHLLEQAFQLAAHAEADQAQVSEFPDHPQDHQRILDQVFDGQRLLRLPSKHSHRLVVLDHLVQRFEPGEKYSELQVNAKLTGADVDVATLRRYLVDTGMLDRADGRYWRSGGTVITD